MYEFTPEIIEGENIDLLSPFPIKYLPRLAKWTKQYNSLIIDTSEVEALAPVLEQYITTFESYAVVDKNNSIQLAANSGPVLVGAFIVTPASPYNKYVHIIAQRRAWGKDLIEEGFSLLVKKLFEEERLQRLSAYATANNWSMKKFIRANDFMQDGYMQDMTNINGKPRDVIHYGLTRSTYFKEI